MKLSTLPVWDPKGLMFDYDERDVEGYVHLFSELLGPLTARGIRENEVPDDFFEAHVFVVFFYGAAGMFTASGSLFCANWRWMPAAERMARKIGATALADQLAAAWKEVQQFSPAILDAFDRQSLIWSRPPPIKGENVSRHYYVSTYVPEDVGERISYLLNEKWRDCLDLPLDQGVEVSPYAEYRLQGPLAGYLSSIKLPYEAFDDRKKFADRIDNILDDVDDYEARLAGASGRNPFETVWDEVRNNTDKFVMRNGQKFSEIYFSKTIRSNVESVAADGFLLSEVWTSCGQLLVAYYKDAVQIVDPETYAELAIGRLPEPFAMRSKAKERLTHSEAWPWRLGEGFHPIRA